jgi:hypothetical protein
MRPQATSVCGLTILVYEALSYQRLPTLQLALFKKNMAPLMNNWVIKGLV